jgi:hypothetical protein
VRRPTGWDKSEPDEHLSFNPGLAGAGAAPLLVVYRGASGDERSAPPLNGLLLNKPLELVRSKLDPVRYRIWRRVEVFFKPLNGNAPTLRVTGALGHEGLLQP